MVDDVEIDGQAAEHWVEDAVTELETMENVRIRTRCMGAGVYDHGYVTLYERVGDHTPGEDTPRHRLWKVRTKQVVAATGAIERPLSFAGNDLPGVMLAGAVRDYVVNYGVEPGRRAVVVTNNDDGYRTALVLHEAGIQVKAVVDPRPEAMGALPQTARAAGIRIETGTGLAKVKGIAKVEGVALCAQGGEGFPTDEFSCDLVAMSGGWSPVVHLWSHCGGKVVWDDAAAQFRPDADRPPTGVDGAAFVRTAGCATGPLATGAVLEDAHVAGRAAAEAAGFNPADAEAPAAAEEDAGAIAPIWVMPRQAKPELRAKMWLDYQNDVKVSDVQLAPARATRASSTPSATPRSGWRRTRGSSRISTAWRSCRRSLAPRSRRWAPPPSARPIRPFPWAPSRVRRGGRSSSRSAAPRSTPGTRRTVRIGSPWATGGGPTPS